MVVKNTPCIFALMLGGTHYGAGCRTYGLAANHLYVLLCPGGSAVATKADLARFIEAEREARRRDISKVARSLQRVRGSVTNRAEEGAAVLEEATEDRNVLHDLEPVDWDLLKRMVEATRGDFDAAHAERKLAEEHVQKLLVSLLKALGAAHPMGSVEVHDTHATGSKAGMHRCKPDILTSDCWVPLAPHVVDFFECKAELSNQPAQQDAAYQMDERRRQLLPEQPNRGVFWGCSAGLDFVQMWQMDRDGASVRRTPLLPLSCQVSSPGLQAIVRLWCTPPRQKGYQAPRLPAPIKLEDGRQLIHPMQITTTSSSSSTGQDAAKAMVTSVVLGVLTLKNGEGVAEKELAVAKTTSNKQRLNREVRALQLVTAPGHFYMAICRVDSF